MNLNRGFVFRDCVAAGTIEGVTQFDRHTYMKKECIDRQLTVASQQLSPEAKIATKHTHREGVLSEMISLQWKDPNVHQVHEDLSAPN